MVSVSPREPHRHESVLLLNKDCNLHVLLILGHQSRDGLNRWGKWIEWPPNPPPPSTTTSPMGLNTCSFIHLIREGKAAHCRRRREQMWFTGTLLCTVLTGKPIRWILPGYKHTPTDPPSSRCVRRRWLISEKRLPLSVSTCVPLRPEVSQSSNAFVN